ncbi:MAG: hypothetical protein OER97_04115 [Gammaproteobacteria bacterium]|nr:hypothetical protein [Gammaproteobacteria bacterium]
MAGPLVPSDGLLLGHATRTFLRTEHIPVDQASCESCAGQGEPVRATPPSVAQLFSTATLEIGI